MKPSVLTLLLLSLLMVGCSGSRLLPTVLHTDQPSAPTETAVPAQKASAAPATNLENTAAPLSPTVPPAPTATPISSSVWQATPTSDLPEEYYITEISGHRQTYPLGCETSAAVDWAAYYGVEIFESEFQYGLPQSDNPDYGFVGLVEDPWGQVPPYSYGVHASPVADLLQEYGLDAVGMKDVSITEIKRSVAAGHPVIAWVIGNVVGGVPYLYTDSQGRTVTVAAYEHVVIITGYNNDSIRYMNNGRFYDIPTDVFLNSWGVLGNMVVLMAGE